jgi:hypothetical protein
MLNTSREFKLKWVTFRKGLNTFVSANRIDKEELSIAENVFLKDEGTPVKRGGTKVYGNSGGSSPITLLGSYTPKTIANYETIIIENGTPKKYNETSQNYVTISGATFDPNKMATSTMINNILYIANGVDDLTKYNGSTLTRFTGVSTPTGLSVTRGASLISGTNTLSYKITALSAVGESIATSATTVATNLPRDQWNFNPNSPDINRSVLLQWTASTGATGYNIYGVTPASETYIDTVQGGNNVTYRDYGTKVPSSFFTPPIADTSKAPKGNIITTFQSSLIIAGDPDEPSRLYYSAGVDKPESFLISDGGGFIDISKDKEDGAITGLIEFQGSVIVFKERSIWRFDFTESGIPLLQNISKSVGCISHNSIVAVENDIFFVGRKGDGLALYSLGNEPNFQNILRTNEVSVRVKGSLQGVLPSNYAAVSSVYYDGKVFIAYCTGSGTANNTVLVYDRERAAYSIYTGISVKNPRRILDSKNVERFLYIDDSDNTISQYDVNITTDKGQPIKWVYASKLEDLGMPAIYKFIKWVNMNFIIGKGTVKIRIKLDQNEYVFDHTITQATTATAFRSLKFRKGKFRVSNSLGAQSEYSYLRIPIGRLGKTAEVKQFGIEISGSQVSSNAGLQQVEYVYKLRSDRQQDINTIKQI